ncbi:mechanosensitive ion channel family protein [Marinobacter koreensis]|uniref:Mechanosensitive ion channel family protein n=1 Tax=Marinobacter koreensis TaxID=335974 RepID=A0ABW0RI34_9GAMM|nr:mechanosensitive ion channel family protein [Marinobacter koreensis]MCK7547132.1 mechanosensitive ion channel family protein [Marinobacter koreensis]MDX1816175.1 mechanosensitive ion channel family protein [Marinobacter sp.]
MVEELLGLVNRWIEGFGVLSQGWRVGVMIFVLVFATAVVAYLMSHLIRAIERKFDKTRNLWDDALLHALRKPVVLFVWLQGVYWAAEVAHHYSKAEVFRANRTVLELGFIWVVVWTLLRLIKQAEKILVSPLKMKRPMDYTTVNAVSKLSRAVVIITAALIVLQSLGYSISGVLAFGGVGGIAVGFAAKDLLANFFGGMIVHLDRPFKVGDWVRSPDRNIEGTVEHIGWRVTTIRTFDQRPLYVPNAAFTTISVENPSRMHNRRIYETIGIRYADVSEMATIVSEIRSMLENHEEIDTGQTLIVNFVAFNNSSLDIMVYTFTKTTQWVRYHEIKQDVLLKISEIIESHDAEVAFPTRTLHLPEGIQVSSSEVRESEGEGRAAPSQNQTSEKTESAGQAK